MKGMFLYFILSYIRFVNINHPPNLVQSFNRADALTTFISIPKLPVDPVDSANTFGNFKVYKVDAYFINNLSLPLFYMVFYFICGYFLVLLKPKTNVWRLSPAV